MTAPSHNHAPPYHPRRAFTECPACDFQTLTTRVYSHFNPLITAHKAIEIVEFLVPYLASIRAAERARVLAAVEEAAALSPTLSQGTLDSLHALTSMHLKASTSYAAAAAGYRAAQNHLMADALQLIADDFLRYAERVADLVDREAPS